MDERETVAMSWFGDVYRKLETLRVEDGFQYFENQLLVIGESVEQFCSEYLPPSDTQASNNDHCVYEVLNDKECTAGSSPDPSLQMDSRREDVEGAPSDRKIDERDSGDTWEKKNRENSEVLSESIVFVDSEHFHRQNKFWEEGEDNDLCDEFTDSDWEIL